MQDRIPVNPGRVLISPENGAPYYATMTRADNATQEGTPLNKNSLLRDATAALFGLGADAVPDDVFGWFGYYTKHLWNKRTHTTEAGYVEVKTKATRNDGYYITQGNSRTIYVATSISINQSNGEISLKNPVTLKSNGPGYFDNYRTAADLTAFLRGKYVLGLYGVSYGDHPLLYLDDTVIVDSVGDYTDGISFYLNYMGGSPYVLTSQYFNNAYIGDWEVISSDTSDAYPKNGIVDGYEYRYVGVPFENMKFPYTQIETGSYAGTGTYGASNPNSLTFDFMPKVVLVADDTTNDSSWGALMFYGTKRYTSIVYSGAEPPMHRSNNLSWSGNTVTWYNNMDATNGSSFATAALWRQLNASGVVYKYIAIG